MTGRAFDVVFCCLRHRDRSQGEAGEDNLYPDTLSSHALWGALQGPMLHYSEMALVRSAETPE